MSEATHYIEATLLPKAPAFLARAASLRTCPSKRESMSSVVAQGDSDRDTEGEIEEPEEAEPGSQGKSAPPPGCKGSKRAEERDVVNAKRLSSFYDNGQRKGVVDKMCDDRLQTRKALKKQSVAIKNERRKVVRLQQKAKYLSDRDLAQIWELRSDRKSKMAAKRELKEQASGSDGKK